MVYLYYLKFKVVSPSKDALVVNNVLMTTVSIIKVFVFIRT